MAGFQKNEAIDRNWPALLQGIHHTIALSRPQYSEEETMQIAGMPSWASGIPFVIVSSYMFVPQGWDWAKWGPLNIWPITKTNKNQMLECLEVQPTTVTSKLLLPLSKVCAEKPLCDRPQKEEEATSLSHVLLFLFFCWDLLHLLLVQFALAFCYGPWTVCAYYNLLSVASPKPRSLT